MDFTTTRKSVLSINNTDLPNEINHAFYGADCWRYDKAKNESELQSNYAGFAFDLRSSQIYRVTIVEGSLLDFTGPIDLVEEMYFSKPE